MNENTNFKPKSYSAAISRFYRLPSAKRPVKNGRYLHGINGRILSVIFNMYQNAKSCVKSAGKLSDFFTCNTGVRQGENLSPILFAMYINDFHESLACHYSGLNVLNENVINELDLCFKMYLLLCRRHHNYGGVGHRTPVGFKCTS